MRNPISSIPHLYRNLRRWREILTVLSKYGLAGWLSRLNIDVFKGSLKSPDGDALARLSREARIRLAMTELGPTFIKLGQLLSTRPDLAGAELAAELKQLQDDVSEEPFEQIRTTVEHELGQPLDEIFAEFHPEPLASASIGQVHAARLKGGDEVVVKVQHTGIERQIRQDLDVLAGLAQLAERFEEFKPYRPKTVVAEMSRTLRREIDFGREERNLNQFAAQFAENDSVRIPMALTEFCTSRVLTMERIEGTKLQETSQLAAFGIDLDEVAKRGVAIYFDMIFKYGFYHADPHPGNIVLLPGNVIGLLDFGMVGRVNERLREQIEDLLLAIINQDGLMLASIVQRIGQLPPEFDESLLINDLAEFVGHYSTQSFQKMDMGNVLNDLMGIIRRHHILLPSEAALLIKTLITLEGTARLLSPEFSLAEALKPFRKKMLRRRLSPARQFRKMRRLYMEVEQLVEVLPQRIGNILEQIQSGRFDVHLDHRRLGPSVNRLVLGMMTSALFLGSSFMLSYKVPPFIFPENTYFGGMHQLSILGLAGCFMSMLIGLRLFLAIRKSGHLDKKDE